MSATIFYCKMATFSTILCEVFCRTFFQKSSPPEARIPRIPSTNQNWKHPHYLIVTKFVSTTYIVMISYAYLHFFDTKGVTKMDNSSLLGSLSDELRQIEGRYGRATCARPTVGHSRPTAAVSDIPPQLDGGNGRRRCDGTMPEERQHQNGRSAAKDGWGLYEHPLAMVYSPYQIFRDVYPADVALDRGTLFSELDLPFERAGK